MIKRVAIVSNQFSVVVKSIEKKLTEINYSVTLMDFDIETLIRSLDDIDVLLMYLQDAVLADHKKVSDLFLLCDTLKDKERDMILISSDADYDLFKKSIPALSDFKWFPRPVDMPMLVGEMEKQIKQRKEASEKKKVLIIDDDTLFASMMGALLKDRYAVDFVEDGMKGISYLVTNKVDMILLDYEMPVVDGPKILEMLRMHPNTSNIPVIFLTGVSTKAGIQRVLSLRPQGYILKSMAGKDLLRTLNDYFEKHKYDSNQQ